MVWLLRIVLGGIITGAGIGKLLDVGGFVSIVDTYRLGLNRWLRWAVAIAIIVFEILLGIAILTGYQLRAAAIGSIIMHFGYLFLVSTALLRGLKLKNCGCFGVFLARPLSWYTPLEDLALIILSFGLFRLT